MRQLPVRSAATILVHSMPASGEWLPMLKLERPLLVVLLRGCVTAFDGKLERPCKRELAMSPLPSPCVQR